MWRRTNRSGEAIRSSVKAIGGNYGSHPKKASWICLDATFTSSVTLLVTLTLYFLNFSTTSTAKTLAGSLPNQGKASVRLRYLFRAMEWDACLIEFAVAARWEFGQFGGS
jgi:hypothetical protein